MVAEVDRKTMGLVPAARLSGRMLRWAEAGGMQKQVDGWRRR